MLLQSQRPWLIVAGDFSPHGGMDRANYELAHYIAQRRLGHLHLVAHRISEPLASMPGVTLHRVARPAGRHALGSWLLAHKGRQIAKQLRTTPTRVIVNGGNCRWRGTNWVHYVHRAYRPYQRGMPILYRLKNLIARVSNVWAERQCLARSRLIIANSQRTSDDVRALPGTLADRIHVVYLGIDPERYSRAGDAERTEARARFGFSASSKVVLFLGALGFDQRKGFDIVLRAFRRLPEHILQEAQLLVIGHGRLDYWQRLIGVDNERVRLIGPRDDVPTWLAAADLLVSPTRYEAYGMAVQEAICRGLPAIVSKTAGVAERYPNELAEMILPDPEDSIDLARRMEEMLRERSRWQPHIDALGERLRCWTWSDMAEQMIQLIETHN